MPIGQAHSGSAEGPRASPRLLLTGRQVTGAGTAVLRSLGQPRRPQRYHTQASGFGGRARPIPATVPALRLGRSRQTGTR